MTESLSIRHFAMFLGIKGHISMTRYMAMNTDFGI